MAGQGEGSRFLPAAMAANPLLRGVVPRRFPLFLRRPSLEPRPLAAVARRRKAHGLRLPECGHEIDRDAPIRPLVCRWSPELLLLRPVPNRFADQDHWRAAIYGIQPGHRLGIRSYCRRGVQCRLQPGRESGGRGRPSPALDTRRPLSGGNHRGRIRRGHRQPGRGCPAGAGRLEIHLRRGSGRAVRLLAEQPRHRHFSPRRSRLLWRL